MKLVVLGASGGCAEVVQQAQAAGHHVVVVGRESSDLPTGDALEEHRGDLTDVGFLSRAFEGADVVVLAVGFDSRVWGFGIVPRTPNFWRTALGRPWLQPKPRELDGSWPSVPAECPTRSR